MGEVVSAETSARSRGRPLIYVGFLTASLVALMLASAILVTYVAFDRQDSRLADLQSSDARFAAAQRALEARLARHERQVDLAVRLAERAYERGFRAGRSAGRVSALGASLPSPLRALGTMVTRGFLVPRAVPAPLRGTRVRVSASPTAYRVAWPGLTFVASSRTPASAWLARGRGGRITGRIGTRRLTRVETASGIVYVWSERSRTYAAIATERTELLVRDLVLSLR